MAGPRKAFASLSVNAGFYRNAWTDTQVGIIVDRTIPRPPTGEYTLAHVRRGVANDQWEIGLYINNLVDTEGRSYRYEDWTCRDLRASAANDRCEFPGKSVTMARLACLGAAASLMLLLAHQPAATAQERYTDVMHGIGDANYGIFDDNNPYATERMLNHVRRERFDLILPRVMRDHGVDMWIHVIRPWSWGGTDPMRFEFGTKSAVLVFTDNGDEWVERVVFEGEVEDPSVYDLGLGENPFVNQENYELMDLFIEQPDLVLESELDLRFTGLGQFVVARDPLRIAVNYGETLSLPEGSETFTMALTDGISYTDYVQLTKALGELYASRMVSAESVILDYLSRRVLSEVVLYATSGALRSGGPDFAAIVPGVTTLDDIGATDAIDKDGNWRRDGNYIVQRGDLVSARPHMAYVLKNGETGLPPYMQRYNEDNRLIRQILHDNIRVGQTGGEALGLLARALEDAGYIYTDYQEYNKYVDDPHKTQVHLDLHAEGKGILGPRISPMGPKWHWNINMPLFHTFAVEYMFYVPVPEWDRGNNFTGQTIYGFFHDGGVLTGRGMEVPYPDRPNEIQVIQ